MNNRNLSQYLDEVLKKHRYTQDEAYSRLKARRKRLHKPVLLKRKSRNI